MHLQVAVQRYCVEVEICLGTLMLFLNTESSCFISLAYKNEAYFIISVIINFYLIDLRF